MGGAQFKYKQISECNFGFGLRTYKVVFNHDFSIVYMIQRNENQLQLFVAQFKYGKMKTILSQRIEGNQVPTLLSFKNSLHFLRACEQKGGMLLSPVTASNNQKYLIRLQHQYIITPELMQTITCFTMNKKESLIVSGGCILQFWTSQNGWRMTQWFDLGRDIKQICFNQSETKIIVSSSCQIIVYHYDIAKLLWVQQSTLKINSLTNCQFINDDIFLVRTTKVKKNILGNCSQQDVIESYVLNKLNGQFDQKMVIEDEGFIKMADKMTLYYSPIKQIVVSISQSFLKFMNIKDDGRISIEQIINLELQYDYLSISQDLRYFVACKQNLMRVFQLNEI